MTTTGAIGAAQDPWHVFERYIERLREVLDVTLATRAAKYATAH